MARNFSCSCSGCLVEEESRKRLELAQMFSCCMIGDINLMMPRVSRKVPEPYFPHLHGDRIYLCVYMSWQLTSWLLTLSEEVFQSC